VDVVEPVLASEHTRAVVWPRIDGYATRMRDTIYISIYMIYMLRKMKRKKKQENMN
jgi:hypothetical protein